MDDEGDGYGSSESPVVGRNPAVALGRWQAKFTNPHSVALTPAPDTFPTKRAANEWLATKQADLMRGIALDDKAGERPLRFWWDGFERSMATLKPKTQTSYEAAWRLRWPAMLRVAQVLEIFGKT